MDGHWPAITEARKGLGMYTSMALSSRKEEEPEPPLQSQKRGNSDSAALVLTMLSTFFKTTILYSMPMDSN